MKTLLAVKGVYPSTASVLFDGYGIDGKDILTEHVFTVKPFHRIFIAVVRPLSDETPT